jgi:Fanconi-associated nuclease 1
VVRFIFALLFQDILFKPVPGAFETEYQTGPLDLDEDSFYFIRQEDIIRRLEAIESGQALRIAKKVDAEHREKKTIWVGTLWDRFAREDILAIIEVSKLCPVTKRSNDTGPTT